MTIEPKPDSKFDFWDARDVVSVLQQAADNAQPGQTPEETIAAIAEAFRLDVQP